MSAIGIPLELDELLELEDELLELEEELLELDELLLELELDELELDELLELELDELLELDISSGGVVPPPQAVSTQVARSRVMNLFICGVRFL